MKTEPSTAAAAWLVLIGISTLVGLLLGWRIGVGVAAAIVTVSGLNVLSGAQSKD